MGIYKIKLALITSIIIVALLFTSCTNIDTKSTSFGEDFSSSASSVQDNNEMISANHIFYELQENKNSGIFKIIDATYKNYENMHYPKIYEELSNEELSNDLNLMIYNHLDAFLSSMDILDEKLESQTEKYDIALNYNIETLNDKFLSVKYVLVFSNNIMSHPNVQCFTLNLNLEQCKYITLSDMVNINTSFWNDFILSAVPVDYLGEYSPWYGAYYPPQTQQGLMELKACDNLDFEKNNYSTFSYYKDNKLFLCFVKDHVAGAYIIFEYKFEN